MTYSGYLRLGETEIINNQRAYEHARHGVCSRSLELLDDPSWQETHVWLGEDRPVTPAATGAPWYDPGEPASAEFGGVYATSIGNLATTTLEQDVTEGTGDGGSALARRFPTRVMPVECALFASSSRGLQYGLRWLTRSLLSEGCGGSAEPRDMLFLEASPEHLQWEQPADTMERVALVTRQLTRVLVTSAPEVTEWAGSSMLRGDGGACTALVEFELTALVPRIWRSPVVLLQPQGLRYGEQISTRFQELAPDGSCPAQCEDDDGVLVDPLVGPMWALPRPAAPGADIGCQLLDSRRSLFTIQEHMIPLAGEMLPTVTIRTAGREERNIRIRWARGLVTDDGAALDCQTVGEAMVTYLPPEAVLVLDGRSGTAVVHTEDGRELDATPVTVGRAGGPWRAPVLRCGAPYTVVIDADVPTRATVEVTGVTGEF